MLLNKVRKITFNKYISYLFLLSISILISGCFKLNYFLTEKLTNHPPPVHINSDANLYFTADVDINPDFKYYPTPVPLTLVQLKDNKKYLTANKNMLIDNPETCLEDSALEYYHFKINPGQNKDILIKLRPETRYLVVIGKYHNTIKVHNSAIVALPKLIVKDHYYTYVSVTARGVEFIPE